MKWLIVIPTIRRHGLPVPFEQTRATTIVGTDMLLLDGADGLCQALNRIGAYVTSQHDIIATIDDDVVLPFGWQWPVEAAMSAKDIGLVGLDIAHSNVPLEEDAPMVDGIRELKQANIWGGVMCYPREVFHKMKPIPIVPGTTYHYYSDYSRTLDVRKLGYRTVYVKTATPPLHVVVDTPERTEEKRQQTQKCMEHRHLWDPSYRRA